MSISFPAPLIARIALASVLAVTGALKLAPTANTNDTAAPAALLLTAAVAEIGLALALSLACWRQACLGCLVFCALAGAYWGFSAATGQPGENCGCFGPYTTPGYSHVVVLAGIALLAGGAYLLPVPATGAAPPPGWTRR